MRLVDVSSRLKNVALLWLFFHISSFQESLKIAKSLNFFPNSTFPGDHMPQGFYTITNGKNTKGHKGNES